MTEQIPTEMLVSAQINIAAMDGIPIMILHKGDPTSGAILLKINHLNGKAIIYTQVWMNDQRVWTPHSQPIDEREADKIAHQEATFDPDLWLIEVEDKKGRIWFPGKIME